MKIGPELRWAKGAPKCVFISGGGSGIGLAMGVRLVQAGCHVAIFNRSPATSALVTLQTYAVSRGQRIHAYMADVSDEDAIRQAVAHAVTDMGTPDLCINSAGIISAAPFDELTANAFTHVVNVNLVGSRHFAAAVLPHLHAGAHLTFISSMAGLVGNYAYAAYCASKYGVVGLAEVLRIELKPRGIDVSVCCPAELPTPLVSEERKTLHPAAAALKDLIGTMPLDAACDDMLQGMARRQFMIVPGLMPRLSCWAARHFPAAMRLVTDLVVARSLRATARSN